MDIFKAYDVRGRYPSELDEDTARVIGAAVSKKFGAGNIVVARDARLSSGALYRAALDGIKKTRGAHAVKIGLSTTPMFYFLVNHFKAVGGIMITASHNPKEFNGAKVVGSNAAPVSGREIYELITKNKKPKTKNNDK